MKSHLLAIGLFMVSLPSIGQKEHNQNNYFLNAIHSETPVKLDGKDEDDVWEKALEITDFWLKYPSSDRKSTSKTTVKAAFDEKFLYFYIVAFDSTNTYTAPSLKRDNSLVYADGIAIVLDPFNKKTNGFGFNVTPNNVQSEYLVEGSLEEVSFSWDNRWFSEAIRYDDKYTIEVAIPFKSLRFDAKTTTWGINIIRSDKKKNEFSTWTNVPVQFAATDLGYTGTLQFSQKLTQQKSNIALIPYVTSELIVDNMDDYQEPKMTILPFDPEPSESNTQFKANAGFDAKVAITPSLNLDLTVNPNFSDVEVDEQVTNLTRFSIFFPEKRTFFLENSDIFSSYGAQPFRPFNSRTIGLDKDAQPIPILFGARLSGNISEKTRIGIMNIQTGKKGDFEAQNYSAISFQQRFGSRSFIKGYFLNRDATGLKEEERISTLEKFGRNYGAELNLIDKTGSHMGWLGYHGSIKEGIDTKNSFYQGGYGYFGRNFSGFVDYARFGQNYYADMGFINRLETHAQTGPSYMMPDTSIRAGYQQMYQKTSYTLRPKESKLKVVSWALGLSHYYVWFEDGKLSDKTHSISSEMQFENTSYFKVEYNIQKDNLRYYFPLPSEAPLSPGTYNYDNVNLEFTSDSRKNAVTSGGFTYGKFYNGKIRQYNLNLLLRKQPYISTTLSAQLNDLIFPENYGRTSLVLIGSKIEATFTDKLFWTTFLQFNTQQNNFNINSRVQYRYSPMSDFFLVYTDNYYSNSFLNKNRAIVFKWNYWLSL